MQIWRISVTGGDPVYDGGFLFVTGKPAFLIAFVVIESFQSDGGEQASATGCIS